METCKTACQNWWGVLLAWIHRPFRSILSRHLSIILHTEYKINLVYFFICIATSQVSTMAIYFAGNITIWEQSSWQRKSYRRSVCIYHFRGWQLHGLFLGGRPLRRSRSNCQHWLEDWACSKGLGLCCKKRKNPGIHSNILLLLDKAGSGV